MQTFNREQEAIRDERCKMQSANFYREKKRPRPLSLQQKIAVKNIYSGQWLVASG